MRRAHQTFEPFDLRYGDPHAKVRESVVATLLVIEIRAGCPSASATSPLSCICLSDR
jgi:hypothetical protein